MSALREALAKFEKDELDGKQVGLEDDVEDGTEAHLQKNDKTHYQDQIQKSLIKPMMTDTSSEKYSGVKVTREELEASSEESEIDNESDNDDDLEFELLQKMNKISEVSDDKVDTNEEEDLTKLFAIEEDDEEDNASDEDDEEVGNVDMENDEDGEEVEENSEQADGEDEEIDSDDEVLGGGMDELDIFKRREEKKGKLDMEKISQTQNSDESQGKGILDQIQVFDEMVKVRIRMQKLLQASATLPLTSNIPHFNMRSSERTKLLHEQTLKDMIELEEVLSEVAFSFDEIPKKRKLDKFHSDTHIEKSWGSFVSKRQKIFDSTWESVKHGATGNNPNVAVNTILQDPDRLLRRSRMKKSFGGIRLGETTELKEDCEQYDDTGLYQSILRNVINSKADTSNSSDPIEMTRHWLKLERMQKKQTKSAIDTKASKGRKVRYNVHPKLVGFFPKRDQARWTHQQRNQLFRGVFQ